ncbi:hypothetical protein WA026_005266 [Henosepilachna vigintioctopunctata]|uniref:Uncharacterized protein n=1 Tax=Henosepilachna vigintioctopunctata TaxID=420089 RepID=A0AAW1UU62_9CUCU
MLRLSMLLSCIFMTNQALDEPDYNSHHSAKQDSIFDHFVGKREISADFDNYAVTCYICVNVSDNVVCNQYAIDKPCKPGETFCHTLHIMDSRGTSVLVNKKCTTDKECQRMKVGCVEIDSQKICVSCCDKDYCNADVPTNSSNANFDNRISKMRMLAKNLFTDQEKAMTTTIRKSSSKKHFSNISEIISILIANWLIFSVL